MQPPSPCSGNVEVTAGSEQVYDEVILGDNLGALLRKTCRFLVNNRSWRPATSGVP